MLYDVLLGDMKINGKRGQNRIMYSTHHNIKSVVNNSVHLRDQLEQKIYVIVCVEIKKSLYSDACMVFRINYEIHFY